MSHPDHSKEITRIKRIIGQLEGVQRMIEDGQYCINILNQTKAISSAVHSLEAALLENTFNIVSRVRCAAIQMKRIKTKRLKNS